MSIAYNYHYQWYYLFYGNSRSLKPSERRLSLVYNHQLLGNLRSNSLTIIIFKFILIQRSRSKTQTLTELSCIQACERNRPAYSPREEKWPQITYSEQQYLMMNKMLLELTEPGGQSPNLFKWIIDS
ncbi:hypothetical protein K435DRAFT_788826 [Dendrothele bispora CBS 962.96]|uniref:Uncharacterized protein n=1 Tax=Dendrothele bispora (strain CBS 962.96) TaxID=1314807 RepID=A0A4S8MUV9_DENBC|nr:hypothetical protein K435DRAFT_788826 [Dendrothele bispora CBS 962.96]